MANTPVQRPVTTVNPMFFIPEGTDELKYGDIKPVTTEEVDQSLITILDDNSVDSESFGTDSSIIQVPQILSVVSQTLRRGPGGNNVVDIVVEIDGDGSGISKYEFRVTKA